MKKIKNVLLLICAVLTVANSFSIFFLHNSKSEDTSCNETTESSDEAGECNNVYYLNSYKSIEVLDCPFCGGNIKILPINESFFIYDVSHVELKRAVLMTQLNYPSTGIKPSGRCLALFI